MNRSFSFNLFGTCGQELDLEEDLQNVLFSFRKDPSLHISAY